MSNELDDMFDSLLGGLEDITTITPTNNPPPPTNTRTNTKTDLSKISDLDDLISELTPMNISSPTNKNNTPPQTIKKEEPKREEPKKVEPKKEVTKSVDVKVDVKKVDELDSLINEFDTSSNQMNLDQIRDGNKAIEIQKKMYGLGYMVAGKRPTNVVVDEDGNIATNFKFLGSQTAILGKIHTITVAPVDDNDQSTPLYNYNKYVTMIAIDLNNGQEVEVYCKDNGDKTYDFSFMPQALGQVNLEILLCGGPLFELVVSVENITAGDWIAQTNPQHQLGEHLKINIVPKGTDYSVLPGPLPFKVDAQGNMQDLNIVSNDDGTCSISVLPLAVGRIQLSITLHEQHISNSPLNIFIIDKNKAKLPTLNPTNQPSYSNPTINLKPTPINITSGGSINMTPMNVTPMNSGSINVTPMNSINMTPMNSNSNTPINVTPINITPLNSGNSINMTPMNVTPMNSGNTVNMTPLNGNRSSFNTGANTINITPMNSINTGNRSSMVGLNPLSGSNIPRSTSNINPLTVNRFNVNPGISSINPINNNRNSVVNMSSLGSLGSLNGGINGGISQGGINPRASLMTVPPFSPGNNVVNLQTNITNTSKVGESLDDLLHSISETPTNKKQSSVDELEEMMKELQDYQ
jgi:hypothetical protein